MLAVIRLYTRLARRGVGLVLLSAVAYVLVEAVSYAQTYPDQASRQRLAEFGDQPAVRMLQGIPHAVDTVGGFVVWDGGWFLQALVSIWAVLVTSRLLRAEEDSGRAELVGAGLVSSVRVAAAGLAVVLVGCALVGLGVFGSIVVPSEDVVGAVLFASGVAGAGMLAAAITAVACQLVSVRRRAAGLGAAALGVAFVMRMVANSGESQSALAWLSPFGWMDRMQPFAENNAEVLGLYVVSTATFISVALALRTRRDMGTAMIGHDGAVRERVFLLQSPLRFAWRLTWGTLVAWVIGVGAYSFLVGSLVKSMGEVLADDPAYETYLELVGLTKDDVYAGMVAVMATFIALIISLYLAWRIGAARNEEDSERLEHLLTRPLTRRRWLGGHIALAMASGLMLCLTSGLLTWAGAALTGAPVALSDTLAASANVIPVILVFGSLAIAVLGVAPRLTIAASVAAVGVSYVLSLVGPTLDLPGWLTGFSPFYHLALVPVADHALVQGVVLVALAAATTALGVAAFDRRDVTGA